MPGKRTRPPRPTLPEATADYEDERLRKERANARFRRMVGLERGFLGDFEAMMMEAAGRDVVEIKMTREDWQRFGEWVDENRANGHG